MINNLPINLHPRNLRNNSYPGYKRIVAPKNFSLINNTDETLRFISKLEKCLKQKKKVFVVLKDVRELAHGELVVLLSIMFKFKSEGIDFNGDFPANKHARLLLTKSGFFENLYSDISPSDEYLIDKPIKTHAKKKVDSGMSDALISEASTYLWGEQRRCPGVQRVYLELMQNTNNHASLDAQGVHHWWTTMNIVRAERKVCFSFMDYGIGIIESLSNKKEGKFMGVIDKVKRSFSASNDMEILKLLLDGKVHQTANLIYYRGKGLPGIYNAFLNKKISNLIVLSNKAYIDCEHNICRELDQGLSGTYVYWELNRNNVSLV